MSAVLFELGEQASTGPAYDLKAAASFYLPMRDKAATLGFGTLATRLAKMAEIDAQSVEEGRRLGLAPVFLAPDVYPIDGKSPEVLLIASRVRRLITHPSLRTVMLGRTRTEIDSEADQTLVSQIDELESLMVHPDYKPLGYIEPDFRTFHWNMPTVIDGIAIQKEEVKGDANEGVYTVKNGGMVPLAPKLVRLVELTAYRTSSTPAR